MVTARDARPPAPSAGKGGERTGRRQLVAEDRTGRPHVPRRVRRRPERTSETTTRVSSAGEGTRASAERAAMAHALGMPTAASARKGRVRRLERRSHPIRVRLPPGHWQGGRVAVPRARGLAPGRHVESRRGRGRGGSREGGAEPRHRDPQHAGCGGVQRLQQARLARATPRDALPKEFPPACLVERDAVSCGRSGSITATKQPGVPSGDFKHGGGGFPEGRRP